MKEVRINVYELIGWNAAVSSEDGDLLFDRIIKGLEMEGVLLILDFTNITILTTSFLNAAIGQLYSKYDSPFLRERLKVENLEKEDLVLLKMVIDNAKEYFKNKEKIDAVIRETLEDE